jgi:hypothetical protein
MNTRYSALTSLTFFFFCVTFAADQSAETQRLNFYQLIMNDPLKALQKIRNVYDKCVEECKKASNAQQNSPAYLQALREKLPSFQSECPVFTLNECACDPVLSREQDSQPRTVYEKHIVKMCNSKMTSNKPFVYVSFGSEKTFQDLVTLTKIVSQKPDATIHAHFIDLDYKESLSHQNSVDATIVEARYNQLTYFLKQTFRLATINIYLHSSTDHYMNFTNNNNVPKSDIITATHIRCCDEFSAYKDLVNKNPTALHILLSKSIYLSKPIYYGAYIMYSDFQKNVFFYPCDESFPAKKTVL